MINDIRYGLRQLMKHPGFFLVAVLTLALGIGSNTAIFSVVNAILLKPLPFPSSEQLLAVGMTDTRQKGTQTDLNSLSFPDFFDFRDQNRTLNAIAIYRDPLFALADAQGAQSIHGVKCSAEFFEVLGVKPILGRAFSRDDEQAGGGAGGLKVILSHEFWQKHFGGDKDVLGRKVDLDRREFTVTGVMPAGFQFPIQTDPVDLYVTIAQDAEGTAPNTTQRGSHSMSAIARMKPGTSIEQAGSDLSTIAANLTKLVSNHEHALRSRGESVA